MLRVSLWRMDCRTRINELPSRSNVSLNDFDLSGDNELLADAVKYLVIGVLTEADFANIFYAQYASDFGE